jgi:RNA polymerase sigma-70 factor (ECF subfamily)
MGNEPDNALIGRALGGDEAAFCELIARHAQAAVALIRREIVDRHHRDDILQETLLQAWKDLGQLRDFARFRFWLIAVARNRCRAWRRSTQRRDNVVGNETLEVHMSRLGRIVKPEQPLQETIEAIRTVGVTQRQAAELHYLHGYTIREIARRLSMPEGTVKSRLFHARRGIERALGSDDDTRSKSDERA